MSYCYFFSNLYTMKTFKYTVFVKVSAIGDSDVQNTFDAVIKDRLKRMSKNTGLNEKVIRSEIEEIN